MSDNTTPLPPAGWYPDPAGTPRTRWWNGSSWSDTFGEPAQPAAQPAAQPVAQPAAQPTVPPATPWASPTPGLPNTAPYSNTPAYSSAPSSSNVPAYSSAPAYSSMPSYSNVPAYSSAPAYGSPEPLKAPAGTSPITPFIWPLALLPIISIAVNIVSLTMIDQIITDTMSDTGAGYTPYDLVTGLVAWLAIGLAILFGVLDYRALNRAGVPKPFHWAWIFFMVVSAPVYMIGRSVVVRRRTGTGLAPMFVNLGLILVNVVISIASFVIAIATTIPLVEGY